MDMDPTEKHTITHFSHHHPLESAAAASLAGATTCSGCSLRILPGKDFYHCKACPFSLHRICSNMPRKTRHPAHPNHCLSLLISPPNSGTCKACGSSLSGFCYNCSQCDVSFHVLCSALPLSLAVSSHPHTLRIQFTPPYDFACDLCQKSSHSGWLYRCGFCEFDAHIACAFADQREQSLPSPNTLTRQIVYSVTLMEANRLIDYGIESHELMQLVQQGVMESNTEFKETRDSNSGELQKSLKNKDEEQTVLSYQCSSCFSIELLKSYECQDFKTSAENQGEKMKQENRTSAVVFNPLYKAEKNWVDELQSFDGYEDGRKFGKDTPANGFNGSNNQIILRSNTGSARRSSGWKLFGCFDTMRYKKTSKSFRSL